MTELRALISERELRGYSKLRKAELIAFLQNNERKQPASTPPCPVPRTQQESSSPTNTAIPLTKRQCKRRCSKDTKLAKHFVNLNAEINP